MVGVAEVIAGHPTKRKKNERRKRGAMCREEMGWGRHMAADEAEVEWVDRVKAVPLDSVCVPSADTVSHMLWGNPAIRRSVPSVASV